MKTAALVPFSEFKSKIKYERGTFNISKSLEGNTI
jgi:hypothetical protein